MGGISDGVSLVLVALSLFGGGFVGWCRFFLVHVCPWRRFRCFGLLFLFFYFYFSELNLGNELGGRGGKLVSRDGPNVSLKITQIRSSFFSKQYFITKLTHIRCLHILV